MNIHYLQHVPYETPAGLIPMIQAGGHALTATHLYRDPTLPDTETVDILIVMGGPMGIYDEADYPWLAPEKAFIRRIIESGTPVLGICLGAQLIADVLGAKVYRNTHKEIGWFPITRAPEADGTLVADVFPDTLEAFHWHGDTFDIPDGAVRVAESEVCRNQGFILDNRVIALQFHLETTPESAKTLIENSRDELREPAPTIQTEEAMLATPARFSAINTVMEKLWKELGDAPKREQGELTTKKKR